MNQKIKVRFAPAIIPVYLLLLVTDYRIRNTYGNMQKKIWEKLLYCRQEVPFKTVAWLGSRSK